MDRLTQLHEEMSQEMQFITEKIKIYYNRIRFKDITLKKGNKVYLFTRNIATRRPSKKLNHKKIGPFKIKRSIKGISFKLDLPKIMRIYPVFHASLLKPVNNRTPVIKIPEGYIKGFPTYDVKEILDKQNIDGQDKWLVKWAGYIHENNTWEPIGNLGGSQGVIREYERRTADRGRTRRGKGRTRR